VSDIVGEDGAIDQAKHPQNSDSAHNNLIPGIGAEPPKKKMIVS
jgi:hypothetical protein